MDIKYLEHTMEQDMFTLVITTIINKAEGILIYFFVFCSFKKNLLYFFPLSFSPLISPPPSNHHTIVHVHESFFLSAQSLNPLTSPHQLSLALNLWVCPHFGSVCSLDSTYE